MNDTEATLYIVETEQQAEELANSRIRPTMNDTPTPVADRWLAGYDDNACTLDAHATMCDIERQLAEATAWRPIETAPKDGTEIAVYCPPAHGLNHMASVCAWHEDAGFCVDELREPTHWQPLPNPPTQPID